MAKIYEFEGPDGNTYQFEGPDDALPEKPMTQRLAEGATNLTNKALDVTKDVFRPPVTPQDISKPEIPGGAAKVARNLGNKLDKTLESVSPTAADLLPKFTPEGITQETMTNLAGEGALRVAGKVLKPVGKAVASTLEATSGLKHKAPGVLSELAEHPSRLFRQGKEAAKKVYDKVKPAVDELMNAPLENRDTLEAAREVVRRGGKLSPEQALEARRAVDGMITSAKGKAKDTLIGLRQYFDGIAKTSSEIVKQDKVYKEGVRASASRSLFPMTKTGDVSKLGSLLAILGVGASPLAPATLATAPFLSPLVQSTGAASLGVMRKLLPLALARKGNMTLEQELNKNGK